MTYLTRWRLQLAARSLERTSRGIAEIAADVGYESEAAFNRAFKREFRQPPADIAAITKVAHTEGRRTVERRPRSMVSQAGSRDQCFGKFNPEFSLAPSSCRDYLFSRLALLLVDFLVYMDARPGYWSDRRPEQCRAHATIVSVGLHRFQSLLDGSPHRWIGRVPFRREQKHRTPYPRPSP